MTNTPKPAKPPSAPVVQLHRRPERERSGTVPFDPMTPDAPHRRRRDETQSFEHDGPPTDRHEIPISVEIPAPPPAKSPWDVFPVIPVPARTTLIALGDKITAAFVILQGEAVEFSPSGKAELQPGRVLDAGCPINLRLFGENSEEPLSSVEVVAETDLLIYQITLRDLETNDLNLRRKRERYVRTLIMREAEESQERVNADLSRANARIAELAGVLQHRLDQIKENELRPLKAENAKLKEELARILKDREADLQSVKQFIELILDERFELYDAIRDNLLTLLLACQEIDPKKSAPLNAAVIGLMAKLDDTFKRNMPRVIDPKHKL